MDVGCDIQRKLPQQPFIQLLTYIREIPGPELWVNSFQHPWFTRTHAYGNANTKSFLFEWDGKKKVGKEDFKIHRMTWGPGSVVEYLPSKYGDLGLIPSTARTREYP